MPTSRTPQGATSTERTPTALRPRSQQRAPPMCASSLLAIGPAFSGAVRPAKDATPKRWNCPAYKDNCSKRLSRPVVRSCSSWCPAVPTRSAQYADRLAAVVQSFFPGEEGGAALAGVLSGRVCPSGRLPVGIPRNPGQSGTYLTPLLGLRSGVSTVDPTPLWAFGHGLSYTTFRWADVTVDGVAVADTDHVESTTDGVVRVSLTVSNIGRRAGTDVVQLYLHDPVAQVTRPDVRLIGYARVDVEPGASRRVSFDVSADLSSFTGVGRCPDRRAGRSSTSARRHQAANRHIS